MGIEVLLKNINAVQELGLIVRGCYGPCGLYKILQRDSFKMFNDASSLLEELAKSDKYKNNIEVYPILQLLLQYILNLKNEFGDGSTSVVILSNALLKQVPEVMKKGIHAQSIISSLRKLLIELGNIINNKLSIQLKYENISSILPVILSPFLSKKTNNSFEHQTILEIITKASRVLFSSTSRFNSSNIHIESIIGGSLSDTQVIDGIAFERTFSYAGSEQQPKYITNPVILLLDYELELKHMGETTKLDIRLLSLIGKNEYNQFIDTEWNIFYSKLEKIRKTGCNIVLSKKAIGDYATQYFAEHNIHCCGRVPSSIISLISRGCEVPVFSSINVVEDYTEKNIKICGSCILYEQVSFGSKRYEIFRCFPSQGIACILLRSSSSHLLDQAHSTITSAFKILHSIHQNQGKVVPAACCTELYLSYHLSMLTDTTKTEKRDMHYQLIKEMFSNALLDLPRALLENCGLDANNLISYFNHLVSTTPQTLFGVNVQLGKLEDYEKINQYESAEIKWKVLCATIELVCTILSIDYVSIKKRQ